jgi:hypothetical protein
MTGIVAALADLQRTYRFARRTIARVQTRPSEIYPHLFQGGRDTQQSSKRDKFQGESLQKRKALYILDTSNRLMPLMPPSSSIHTYVGPYELQNSKWVILRVSFEFELFRF